MVVLSTYNHLILDRSLRQFSSTKYFQVLTVHVYMYEYIHECHNEEHDLTSFKK